jgi:hypothetical protein
MAYAGVVTANYVCMWMQASTRGDPEMVLKWDSQMAMKPIAFDQDDHVRSEDAFLDIAVVSRGGRLNSGWKKVGHPDTWSYLTVPGFRI